MTEHNREYNPGLEREMAVATAENPFRQMAINLRTENLEAEAELLDHMATHAATQAEKIYEDPNTTAQPFLESERGRIIAERQRYLLYLVDAASGINDAFAENEGIYSLTTANLQTVGDTYEREDHPIVDRRIDTIYSLLGRNRRDSISEGHPTTLYPFGTYETMTEMRGLILLEEIMDRDFEAERPLIGGTVFLNVRKSQPPQERPTI